MKSKECVAAVVATGLLATGCTATNPDHSTTPNQLTPTISGSAKSPFNGSAIPAPSLNQDTCSDHYLYLEPGAVSRLQPAEAGAGDLGGQIMGLSSRQILITIGSITVKTTTGDYTIEPFSGYPLAVAEDSTHLVEVDEATAASYVEITVMPENDPNLPVPDSGVGMDVRYCFKRDGAVSQPSTATSLDAPANLA